MAWRRSSLALGVTALLVARVAVTDESPAPVALSLLAGAGALWLAVVGLRRRWMKTESTELTVLRSGLPPLVISAVAMVLCVAIVLLALRVST